AIGDSTGHLAAAQPGPLPHARPSAHWRPARAAYVALWQRLLSGRPHRRHRGRYLWLDVLAGRVRSVRALQVEPAVAALPVDAGDRLRPGHAPSRVALDSARRGPLPVELSSMLATPEAIAGLAVCLIIFYDLFQSVVLPRPSVYKLAAARFVLRRTSVGRRRRDNRLSS